MIKELKYVFYFFVIFFYIFFILKYYFSDENKKNLYRSYYSLDEKINVFTADLSTLQSDTENIIHYVENNINQNKKTYNFWKLLTEDEK